MGDVKTFFQIGRTEEGLYEDDADVTHIPDRIGVLCMTKNKKFLILAMGSTASKLSHRMARQHWALMNLETHQETGMLEFPLETMQFFSSGLIMVG